MNSLGFSVLAVHVIINFGPFTSAHGNPFPNPILDLSLKQTRGQRLHLLPHILPASFLRSTYGAGFLHSWKTVDSCNYLLLEHRLVLQLVWLMYASLIASNSPGLVCLCGSYMKPASGKTEWINVYLRREISLRQPLSPIHA